MSSFSLLSGLSIALFTSTDALVRHPLRALLTGFGIMVGVLAVTVVITLGEGAERMVRERIDRLGENLITIRSRASQVSGVGQDNRASLVEADARAISETIEGVAHVAPILDGMGRAVFEKRNTPASIVGTTADYFEARNYTIEAGAVWGASEEATSARVVLIGPTVVAELYPGSEPIGSSLRIGRHLFKVIGLLGEKGQTPFGSDQDNVIAMPIGAMRSKISPGRPGEVRQIVVAAAEGMSAEEISRPIKSLLRQRHRIKDGQGNDFSVRGQTRMAEAQRGIVTVMRLLLLSIAAVSLVIGGIGVMNIMLVSVAERSREIGTRLAVGARGSDILVQFVIEAVVLSVLGGASGAASAALLVSPLEDYFGWPLSLSSGTLVVASVISVTIGVVFGFLPARRAARMDPVEALRRE